MEINSSVLEICERKVFYIICFTLQSLKLSNLMALVYLASTRCHDLVTEVLLIAQKLPMEKLLLFFSYLRPLSLAKHIAENVPQLKERFAKFTAVFNSDGGEVIKQSLAESSNSKRTSVSLSAQMNDSESSFKQLSQGQQIQASCSQTKIVYATVVSAGCYPKYPDVPQPFILPGLLAQSSNCQPSSRCKQEESWKKDVVPFAVCTKHVSNPLHMVSVKEHMSVAMVQGKMGCENCTDATCPRCIQAQSISINNCKEKLAL